MPLPRAIINLLTAGLALFSFLPGTTQPDLQFEHITIEDGLANNEVRCVFQDSKGFMWFGTHSGLNRYDGHEMKAYLHDRDNPESISLVVIQSITEDKQGKIWLAGFGISGINSYDPEKDIFTKYLLPDTQRTAIQHIYEDHRGNLWTGTWDYGILRLDKEKGRFEPFPVALPEGVDKEMVNAILEDSFNQLWFGVSNGIYRFSWLDSTLHFYPLPGGLYGSKDNFVNTIFEDNRKALWVATDNGELFLFQRDQDIFEPYQQPPGYIVTCLEEDGNGRLWIGTNEGLMLFDPDTKRFFPYESPPGKPAPPAGRRIWDIHQDRQGDMWVGTYSAGVTYWSRNRKNFRSVPYPSADSRNSFAKDMYERADGKIWMLANDQVALFDPVQEHFVTESYPVVSAWTLFEDKEGWVWAGTWNSGVARFHPGRKQAFYYQPDLKQAESLPGMTAPNIFQDRQGTIWVNVKMVGLFRFVPAEDSFAPYPIYHCQTGKAIDVGVEAYYEDKEGNLWLGGQEFLAKIHPGRNGYTHYPPEALSGSIVTSIIEDKKGNFWLGTTEGLALFSPRGQKALFWTQKDGLANNFIVGILEDGQGNLWISTVNGLSRFNPQSRQFRNYDAADGLPSSQFNKHAYLKTQNGEMFFGTTEGIARFHPDSIRDNPTIPPVLITHIKINNEEVPVAGTLGDSLRNPSSLKQQALFANELALAHWQKDLSFEFAALNYFHPEKNRYKYHLENYDADWITTDASRPYATYTNLPPGNYTFRVIGSNNDGLWNEEGASLRITIRPPWWFTPWAYSLYAILALTLLYAGYSFQLNRQLARAETHRLRELDQVKTRMYTNISHEFRTPLTIILGLADQLKAQVNEGAKPGLSMIERNGQRLLHLVNQMLGLRKLEAGKMTIHYIQSDIIQYLRHFLEAFHVLAGAKNIRLHFLSDTETLNMDFDPGKLTDIMSNLLVNAIKFSPEDADVYLQVHTMADQLHISVKDRGIGIPAQELPRIFDRFHQAPPRGESNGTLPSLEADGSGPQRGIGIGLALTKALVQLLDGAISVKSTPGKGSEFTVSLPIRNEAQVRPTIEDNQGGSKEQISLLTPSSFENLAEMEPAGNEDAPLVLIVEDNSDVTRYLVSCLQKDYRLICAADGKIGREKAIQEIPDLIICDVMMPEMDGFEVCNFLKKDERTSHIPIILLTARADTASKLQGLRSGADAYLSKPFNEEELKVRLGKLIELRRRLQQRYGGSAFGKDIPPSGQEATSFILEDAFLRKVKAVIEENLSDATFGVQELSRELGLSRSQLFRKIKALTGKSILLYIRSVRLHKAREMLKSTRLNISEVGYMVGFTNPAYFSTAFLNEFGESPSAVRHS
ncbi:MAG: response regulator [Phaeodactylibacter sp.]|nr:response regulator [Phaeodactylibacter sp.]